MVCVVAVVVVVVQSFLTNHQSSCLNGVSLHLTVLWVGPVPWVQCHTCHDGVKPLFGNPFLQNLSANGWEAGLHLAKNSQYENFYWGFPDKCTHVHVHHKN